MSMTGSCGWRSRHSRTCLKRTQRVYIVNYKKIIYFLKPARSSKRMCAGFHNYCIKHWKGTNQKRYQAESVFICDHNLRNDLCSLLISIELVLCFMETKISRCNNRFEFDTFTTSIIIFLCIAYCFHVFFYISQTSIKWLTSGALVVL